ncbi:acyl carrier protein [Paenibacillus harenae]|uniref:Acyl carrier protein n=1 Tax=Paenibacillus harenae TaxID=306543 RepID=A0ABT9U5P7_PAEHA|nr:acyl carrier protein [Paenibacillus harenae]MDQ0114960.1 acyl carrier protein [Paenibacillus harenae]
MTIEEIRERVIDLLELICGDNSTRIREELVAYGDAEIESIFFYEIVAVLEDDLGAKTSDKMLKEIHKRVKSSFNEFCDLWAEMQGGNT